MLDSRRLLPRRLLGLGTRGRSNAILDQDRRDPGAQPPMELDDAADRHGTRAEDRGAEPAKFGSAGRSNGLIRYGQLWKQHV
jgi:hypothetical protein